MKRILLSVMVTLFIWWTACAAQPTFRSGRMLKLDLGNPVVKLEMIPCPAGEFEMGFKKFSVKNRDKIGWQPLVPHKVRISRPFWIGKYPVTYAQFKLLCPDRLKDTIPSLLVRSKDRIKKEPIKGGWQLALDEYGENFAMSNVTIDDANVFLKRLSARLDGKVPKGYVFRLPTQAEWEYVLKEGGRVGDQVLLHSGWYDPANKTNPCSAKNRSAKFCRQNASDEHKWFVIAGCTVGKSKPNGWGAYGMLGNVSQLLLDTGTSRHGAVFSDRYFAKTRVDPLVQSDSPDAAAITTYPGGNGNASAIVMHRPRERWIGFRVLLGYRQSGC